MLLFYILLFFFLSPNLTATQSSGTPVNQQSTTVLPKNPQSKLDDKISNITLNNTKPITPAINNHFASEGGFVETTNQVKSTTLIPDIVIQLFSNNKTNDTIKKSPAIETLTDMNPPSLRHDSLLNNSSESTVHARKEVKFESDELSGIKPRKGVGNPPEKIENHQNLSVIWNSTVVLKPKPKPKPKPMVTTDTDEVETEIKNINHTMDTNSNLSGSKMVLPIVIPILALPLVAGILFIIYKRSSEFWEHRHYRRMDFLIDGMYNE